MKKWILAFLLPISLHTFAQDTTYAFQNRNVEVEERGFKKERLFSGGSANLGFSSGSTMIGVAPQIGYSLTNWADVGINFNFNYISQKFFYTPEKIRQTTFGPGAFVRLFPVNMIFATTQYEYNTIRQKYISGVPGQPSQVASVGANSLLVGGGYAGGRYKGSNTYYFISVMWDIYGDNNSPYVDSYDRSNPIIRAGYNIGLFQGRGRRF